MARSDPFSTNLGGGWDEKVRVRLGGLIVCALHSEEGGPHGRERDCRSEWALRAGQDDRRTVLVVGAGLTGPFGPPDRVRTGHRQRGTAGVAST
jgi:hypothetical protein